MVTDCPVPHLEREPRHRRDTEAQRRQPQMRVWDPSAQSARAETERRSVGKGCRSRYPLGSDQLGGERLFHATVRTKAVAVQRCRVTS